MTSPGSQPSRTPIPQQGFPDTVPERTPEQHAAVRRRALPVAIAALICGIIGAVLPLSVTISSITPPNILAMNMAFCAMLMGVGILFYAKGTPGTVLAAITCVVAILVGMVGVYEYSRQAVSFRGLRESAELSNVKAIAEAARSYAAAHDGSFPPDILALLDDKQLPPQTLQSPFGRRSDLFDHFSDAGAKTSREDLLKSVEAVSDYLYLGSDLKNVPPSVAKDIIVAASTNTVLRVQLALSFADGNARFIKIDDAPGVMKACNEARERMGLGILRPPAILQQALNEKGGKSPE